MAKGLPLIRISVHEVQKHGANVLKSGCMHYVDIEDMAEAMHARPEIFYGALATLQLERSEEMAAIAKAKGETNV